MNGAVVKGQFSLIATSGGASSNPGVAVLKR